jgi:hypothetical protein
MNPLGLIYSKIMLQNNITSTLISVGALILANSFGTEGNSPVEENTALPIQLPIYTTVSTP